MGKLKTVDEMFNPDGSYKTDQSYKEIIKLHELLEKENIPHEFKNFMDGWQVIYPEDGYKRIADAVEICGSYGSDKDLLEILGDAILSEKAVDSVEGCLTAQDVYERIKKHYDEKNKAVNESA